MHVKKYKPNVVGLAYLLKTSFLQRSDIQCHDNIIYSLNNTNARIGIYSTKIELIDNRIESFNYGATK